MSLQLEEYNKKLTAKYYKNLKKILNKNNNITFNSYFDDILSEDNNQTESEIMTISQTISENQTNEDFYYKKPWNKLNMVHKKIKIKQFVNNLMIPKEKQKNLNDKFMSLLNSKKLNKKTDIEYDSINGKIISIPILKCKNDEYYI